MLLNSVGEKKRSSKNASSQKVIIPKGMINPDETTVIEIPSRLHKQAIVVAKHKNSDSARGLLCSSFRTQNGGSAQSPNKPSTFAPVESQFNTNQHRLKPKDGTDLQNAQLNVGSLKNLNMTEEKERAELQKNLEAFQRARRKLLENTTKLTSDPTNKIVKNTCNYNLGRQLRI